MSWSATYNIDNNEVVVAPLLANITEVTQHKEQFDEASKVVEAIIASGAVGSPEGQYRVSLSGHGNPDHEPTSGWANDFVSINIYQEGEPK